MKILIDMSNSPHVLFFRPIIKELEKKGHEVKIIARDHAQTKQLLDLFGMEYNLIGKHAGKSMIKKLLNALSRVLEISRYISKENPDVCISHQSPYIIYASFLKGKKSIYVFDNDQAVQQNKVTFPIASRVMCPESLGEKGNKFIKYPGTKESLYLSSWKNNWKGINKIRKIKKKKILIRTEISGAAYHKGDSLLEVVKKICKKYQVVVSPRTEEQKDSYKKIEGVIVLEKLVDGPTLMKSVDMITGGGGTMNREAAVMGKPVISLYSGELLASDKYLIKKGLMIHNQNPSFELIDKVMKKKVKALNYKDLGKQAIKKIIGVIESLGNIDKSPKGKYKKKKSQSYEKEKQLKESLKHQKMKIILTSDVELWSWKKDFEQDVKLGVKELVKLANKEKIPITLFISLSDKGYNKKDYIKKITKLIKNIKSKCVKIGIHSHCTNLPLNLKAKSDNLKDHSKEDIIKILKWNKQILEKITKNKILIHRAGNYTIPKLEILRECFDKTGLKIDSSLIIRDYSRPLKSRNFLEIPPASNKKYSKKLRIWSPEQMSNKEFLSFYKKAKSRTDVLVINFHSFSVYGSLGKKARIWYKMPGFARKLARPLVKKIKSGKQEINKPRAKISLNFINLIKAIKFLKKQGCEFKNFEDLK